MSERIHPQSRSKIIIRKRKEFDTPTRLLLNGIAEREGVSPDGLMVLEEKHKVTGVLYQRLFT